MPAFLYALMFVGYIVAPFALAWSWVRWIRQERPTNAAVYLALAGPLFASASALLAISAQIYAHAIGGFPFYDPRLLRIYRWGLLLSLVGIVLGLAGMTRKSPIRWLAALSALGTFAFWVCASASE